MERMESLSDPALCLQDLVTGVTTSSANSADLHGVHHHLHDSVSAAVSVSSAISGIMSGASSLGHHVTSHDPHHHGVVPHTPSLHHEPLEKLKRGESEQGWSVLFYPVLIYIRDNLKILAAEQKEIHVYQKALCLLTR